MNLYKVTKDLGGMVIVVMVEGQTVSVRRVIVSLSRMIQS